MKRIFALLLAALFSMSLAACGGEDDAPAPADPGAAAGEEEPAEDEGSKAVTLIFADEIDDDRTDLLEAAEQIAESKGFTLSTVVSLGDSEKQNRFLELARDAGERVILIELADPDGAAEVVDLAGEMAVVFVDTVPSDSAALSKMAVYVGNPEGAGESYLRLTGRTAMRAALNLISGADVAEETELKVSGNQITVPADGVIEK